jgi:hypothetical protein
MAWLLLGLPFASAAMIACIPPLTRLAVRWPAATFVVGISGVAVFFVALLGLLPASVTVAAVLGGAVLGGFSCFWGYEPERPGDDDWRRPPAFNDDPPPSPGGDPRIDWDEFDRLRAEWDAVPR